MYFANLWLLTLVGALAIPTLIHLWRRKRGEVRWAAMSLLQSALQRQSKTRRWSHWLLLLLRCAILFILAIAVAAPYTVEEKRATSEKAEAKVLTVLLLDDSLSMKFKSGGESIFEDAKRQCLEKVFNSDHGDGFCLVRMTDPGLPVIGEPALNQKAIANTVQLLEATQKEEKLEQSFRTAFDLSREHLNNGGFDRAEVFVFSDLAGIQWRDISFSPNVNGSAGGKITFIVKKCGKSDLTNLSLLNLDAVDTVVAPDEISILCEVAGYQLKSQKSEQLIVRLNDEIIFQDIVKLEANRTTQIKFNHRISQAGTVRLSAALGNDGLPEDNQRFKVIKSRESVSVLLVEGRIGESIAIRSALELQRSNGSKFNVRVIDSETWQATHPTGYEIVALCNLSLLNNDDSRFIENQLKAGTSIIVVAGDLMDARSYNDAKRADGVSLFPVEFTGPSKTGFVSFDPLDYQHPIVSKFRNQTDAGLLDTPNWRYMGSKPRQNREVENILAFEDSHPAIVAEGYGTSKLIICHGAFSKLSVDSTTQPPTPWTMFDVWRSFVPLIEQLFVWSISSKNASLTNGLPTRFSGDLTNSSNEIWLAGAEQLKISCELVPRESKWESQMVDTGGFYQLVIDGTAQDTWYAVNVPIGQSDLESIELKQLPEWVDKTDAALDADSEIVYTVESRRWKTKPFFVLLAIFVLMETLWMARIDRHR